MRKLLVVIQLFYFALETSAQGFKAGVFLGINMSQVSGDNLAGYDKPGLAFGGTLGRKIGEKTAWEFRIAYSGKGSRDVPDPARGKYTAYYLKLHYVEVPIHFKYNYKKFWIMAGPSIGALLKWSVQNENGNYPSESLENRAFSKYEVGTSVGLSYQLSDKFEVELGSKNTFFYTPIRKYPGGAVYRWDRGQLNFLISFDLKYNFK